MAKISASYIVKNEEATIIRSLSSIKGAVSEIVVYDTGSTDNTKDLVKGYAATFPGQIRLVEGTWNDDFSAARNASAAECENDWILTVDADESVELLNEDKLFQFLDIASGSSRGTFDDLDAIQVEVRGLAPVAMGPARKWKSLRLFRKSRCEWVGAIHEQVRLKGSGGEPRFAFCDAIGLIHNSQDFTTQVLKAKYVRNLTIAQKALESADSSVFPSHVHISLGRSYYDTGDFVNAIKYFQSGLAYQNVTPIERQFALQGIIRASLNLKDFDLARSSLEELSNCGKFPVLVRVLTALYLSLFGKNEGSNGRPSYEYLEKANRTISELLPESVDESGGVWNIDSLAPVLVENYLEMGVQDEAYALMKAQLAKGVFPCSLSDILKTANALGHDMQEIVDQVVPGHIKYVLAEATILDPAQADEFLEHLHEKWSTDLSIVVVGALVVGQNLNESRKRIWEARLNELQVN